MSCRRPTWEDLPEYVMLHVSSFLDRIEERASLAMCNRQTRDVARNNWGAFYSVDHMDLIVKSAAEAEGLFAGAPDEARLHTSCLDLDITDLFMHESFYDPERWDKPSWQTVIELQLEMEQMQERQRAHALMARIARIAPRLTTMSLTGMYHGMEAAPDVLAARLPMLQTLSLEWKDMTRQFLDYVYPVHLGDLSPLRITTLHLTGDCDARLYIKALPTTLTSLHLRNVDDDENIPWHSDIDHNRVRLPDLLRPLTGLKRMVLDMVASENLQHGIKLSPMTALLCKGPMFDMDKLPTTLQVLRVELIDAVPLYKLGDEDDVLNINLTRLTALRQLSLYHIMVEEDDELDANHLAILTQLTSLSLCGCGPVDPSLLCDATLPDLQELRLDIIPGVFDDDSPPPLPKAPNLSRLCLSMSAVAWNVRQDFTPFPLRLYPGDLDQYHRLDTLVLDCVRLEDDMTVQHLLGLPALQTVVFYRSEVADEHLAKLRKKPLRVTLEDMSDGGYMSLYV